MVEVKYCGQIGNQLFQYCLGRIIAERLGFELFATAIPGFPGTFEKVLGANHRNVHTTIYHGQSIDVKCKTRLNGKFVYRDNGHFRTKARAR